MNAKKIKKSAEFYQWLDFFRWISAFSVLYTHSMNRFLIPLSESRGNKSLLYYLVSFFTGFSHQAVIVFFVLSGFLVGGALVDEYQENGKVDIRTYIIKRFARLWTVLIPALLLSFIANETALTFFASEASSVYPNTLTTQSGIAAFVCTATFLHTVACAPFAANGPLWSIFNEFWYYMIWPLLFSVFLFRGNTRHKFILPLMGVLCLTVLSYFQFTGSSLAPYMLIWLLGVVASVWRNPVVRSLILISIILALFLLATRLGVRRNFWEVYPLCQFAFDLALGSLFALLLNAMHNYRALRAPFGGPIHEHLAAFSFSLYCIHAPILTLYGVAVAATWNLRGPIKPETAVHWVFLLTPIILMIPIAYVFSRGTETKTHKVRHLLEYILPARIRRS